MQKPVGWLLVGFVALRPKSTAMVIAGQYSIYVSNSVFSGFDNNSSNYSIPQCIIL